MELCPATLRTLPLLCPSSPPADAASESHSQASRAGDATLDGLLRIGMPFGTGSQSMDSALTSALPPMRGLLGGDALCAHHKVCPFTGNLVSFSYSLCPAVGASSNLRTRIRVFELSPNSLVRTAERELLLDGYGFVHDLGVTRDHVVLIQNPVDFDFFPFLAGRKSPGQCLSFVSTRNTLIHIVPRDASLPVRTASVPPCFVFHVAAARDTQSGGITIDCVRMPTLDGALSMGGCCDGVANKETSSGESFQSVAPADFLDADFDGGARHTLWRIAVPPPPPPPAAHSSPLSSLLRALRLEERIPAPLVEPAAAFELSPRVAEFPCAPPPPPAARRNLHELSPSPSHSTFVFAAAVAHPTRMQPMQAWTKLRLPGDEALAGGCAGAATSDDETLFYPGPAFFAGEPTFVPRPRPAHADDAAAAHDDDDGWLIGWWFDADQGVSALSIVDARTMALCCWLRLAHAIPYGLHAAWTPQVLF